MKKMFLWIGLAILQLGSLYSVESERVPSSEIVVVGGGIVGALESYYAYADAAKQGTRVAVTVYDKSLSFEETGYSSNTAYKVFPSLTIDEILSVVPRGSELMEKLAILFSNPGGIRVDDVPGVNDSEAALQFKRAVELYGNDINHDDRTQTLLRLGRMSMQAWQDLYDHGDEELRNILVESNYQPCRETSEAALHNGYRIDLIYEVNGAIHRAEAMQATYQQLGYENCRILTPDEVMVLDPFLSDFCVAHSQMDAKGQLAWNEDSIALWRPGGCLDTHTFLPKLYAYLKRVMGTYTSATGEVKDCFNLQFHKEVVVVEFDQGSDLRVVGLKFSDGTSQKGKNCQYIFCPGEAVGTLAKLGFEEPTYAGFAGPSLWFNIPLNAEQQARYQQFNHCMEVHKVGVVLAWQARIKEKNISIGVAGTKAFYGDRQPLIEEDFAKNRHLLLLNMVNDVLPDFISIASGYDTKGLQLDATDLSFLQQTGVLECWVGRRAVAYDGFPTIGPLYCSDQLVLNARCTTHLGSGGGSFAPAAVLISRQSNGAIQEPFLEKVLQYADSRRSL